MNMRQMKQLLNESYGFMNKTHKVDPRTKRGVKAILTEAPVFKSYIKSLAQGLDGDYKQDFYMMASTLRKKLITESNNSYNVTTYETHAFPILRYFYPKLIAKELVNVMPINKPEVIQVFIEPRFRKIVPDSTGASYSGYDYDFPSVSEDISAGPTHGVDVVADSTSGAEYDILDAMGLGGALPSHVERTFEIVGIIDGSGGVTAVSIKPDVDGNFSASVTHENDNTDIISGSIDYMNGLLNWSSQKNNTEAIRFQASASLEENSVNPTMRIDSRKINFRVKQRNIQAVWTPAMEQDMKALYDINLQSEIIAVAGEQVALDIDNEIVSELIATNTTQNPGNHTLQFYKTEKDTFTHGQKAWFETILPKLNELSARIYNDTHMGSANTLACNPLDAAIFESLNGFSYLGDSVAGGELGYRSATVASGKYKLLVSTVVPAGKIIVKYRADDLRRAAYVHAPYVPALLIPYPLGDNPSLTIMSRYANRVIRNLALGQITVNAGQEP